MKQRDDANDHRAAQGVDVPEPPRSWPKRLKALGPGFLWMVSASGSGELLFTPRVGALYGYALLWALLLAIVMKWFINREMGRYGVCTGTSVVDGFQSLPGPRNWAVWLILVPQLLVAVATIAGLAGAAGSAAALALPGGVPLWGALCAAGSALFVASGRYGAVEKAAKVVAFTLGTAALVAAASTLSSPAALARGLAPSVPPQVAWNEVLPWLGFALSGAAGLLWYSYWLPEKGYGLPRGADASATVSDDVARRRLRGWLHQMTLDSTLAVVGTTLVTAAFLVLGTELLKPRGLVPKEEQMASVLGRLLGDVWGAWGYWAMIIGLFVTLTGTVLSDQDGFGRMFSEGTRILLRDRGARGGWLADERLVRRLYVLGLLMVVPIAVHLAVDRPVTLLQIAGAIEAAHIPIVTVLVLRLNRSRLAPDLRPSLGSVIANGLAAAFFAVFAALYVWQLFA